MKRLTLAAGLAALALFPAGALASTPRATVLSVDRSHHTVQLVDAGHLVHAYRYRGKLPRLGVGDRVSFRRSGHAISRVTKTSPASGSISFYARVVRATSGRVLVRLGDGSTFRLSARQVHIQGLTPGVTILIGETRAGRGRGTITVTLPASAASGPIMTAGDDPSEDDQDADGTITRVSGAGLSVNTGSGQLSFSVDPSSGLSDGFLVGDVVDVSYAQNPDGSLRAEDVEYVEDVASGAVTAVSDGNITLDGGHGQVGTFRADPADELFTGVAAGDQVEVTYHEAAGGPVADAVDDQSWDS